MFQSSRERLRAWLNRFDDILADHPAEIRSDEEALAITHHQFHPHRRPLRWDRERRPGSVAARPAHCISPVRGPVASESVGHQPAAH